MKTTRDALNALNESRAIIADREILNHGKARQLWALAQTLPDGCVKRTIMRQSAAVRDGLYPTR